MPRRLINSQIFFNERVAQLPDPGKLLFIGIFSNADDDGRLKASPAYLKALIFPYDDDKTKEQVKDWRNLCADLGLIRVHNLNGVEFLDIPSWLEHQLIRKDRYKPSTLPPFPSGDQPTIPCQPTDNQLTTTGMLKLSKVNISKDKNIYNKEIKIIYNKDGSLDENKTIIFYTCLFTVRQALQGKQEALEANKKRWREELERLGIPITQREELKRLGIPITKGTKKDA